MAWQRPKGSDPRAILAARPLPAASTAFLLGVYFAPAAHPVLMAALGLAAMLTALVLARQRRPWALGSTWVGLYVAGLLVASARLPAGDSTAARLARGGAGPLLLEGRVPELLERGLDADGLLLDLSRTASAAAGPWRAASGRVRLRLSHGSRPAPAVGEQLRVLAELRPAPWPLGQELRSRRLAVRRGVQAAGEALAWSRALDAPAATGVAALPAHAQSALLEGGLAHLAVLEGLALAAALGAAYLTLRRLLTSRRAAAVACLLVLAAALGSAPSPSLWRVAFCLALLLLPPLANRPGDPFSLLSLGALLLAAYDPTCLGDVRFQLPFAAMAAYFRVLPALLRPLPRGGWRWALALPAASVALGLGMLPLWARLFERVSLASMLLALPALPLALVAHGLGATPAAGALATWSWDQVAGLARAAAELGPALGRVPTPTIGECLLFYLGASWLLVPRTQRYARFTRAAGFWLLVGLVAAITHAASRARGDGRLHLTVLPATEGRSLYFTLPDGALVVIEEGPRTAGFDLGERLLVNQLKLERRTTIDLLVVLDRDQADRARDLAHQLPVRELWWPGGQVPADLRAALPLAQISTSSATSRAGVVLARQEAGLSLTLGRTRWAVRPDEGPAAAALVVLPRAVAVNGERFPARAVLRAESDGQEERFHPGPGAAPNPGAAPPRPAEPGAGTPPP